MTGHVLACALFCNGDGGLNGLGTVVSWFMEAAIGLGLVIGALAYLGSAFGRPSGSGRVRGRQRHWRP